MPRAAFVGEYIRHLNWPFAVMEPASLLAHVFPVGATSSQPISSTSSQQYPLKIVNDHALEPYKVSGYALGSATAAILELVYLHRRPSASNRGALGGWNS
jgi:hypothetical protein